MRSKGKARNGIPAHMHSYAHALWRGAFLYVSRGSDSYVRPLGKVHKDGHAILNAPIVCTSIYTY